jgi:hypothetical protein
VTGFSGEGSEWEAGHSTGRSGRCEHQTVGYEVARGWGAAPTTDSPKKRKTTEGKAEWGRVEKQARRRRATYRDDGKEGVWEE